MPATPSFPGFPKEAISFLRELRAHNERAWFNERKSIYEREIKLPAKAFSTVMAARLEDLTAKRHGYKIFRIHRDVRFSKDKTPYNTHLHIAFIPEHGQAKPPCWFFGLDPEKLTLGAGIFAFDKGGLERYRKRVLDGDGAALADMMGKLERQGARFGKPDLKRVPSGYPKDHPEADLLRYKGLSAWIDHPDPNAATKPDLTDGCTADFARLKPVFGWLETMAVA
ncbi:MAG: DUF2461 domain-containing protein [Geminicoccaceae bacterium]